MKKVFVISLAAVMLLCSFDLKKLFGGGSSNTQTTTETTTQPKTVTTNNADGNAAGKALRSLYAQYKTDGKFDYKNLNNILNTISLISSCENLKANAKDKAYWAAFAAGLVTGSEQLVTEEMSEGVTMQLNNIMENVDTSNLDNAMQQAATVKSIATEVSGLLSSFKK